MSNLKVVHSRGPYENATRIVLIWGCAQKYSVLQLLMKSSGVEDQHGDFEFQCASQVGTTDTKCNTYVDGVRRKHVQI